MTQVMSLKEVMKANLDQAMNFKALADHFKSQGMATSYAIAYKQAEEYLAIYEALLRKYQTENSTDIELDYNKVA